MASHKLGIYVVDTLNSEIFKVFDESIYADLVNFVCPRLWITVPGFQVSAEIPEAVLTKGFNLTLTACDLGIQTSKCDSQQNELPDGVYALRYAVSPHEYVFVDINHLRVVKAMKKIQQLYCDLDVADCLLTKDKKERLLDIFELEGRIRVAQSKVACGDAEKGMFIYEDVLKRLEKLNCKYC